MSKEKRLNALALIASAVNPGESVLELGASTGRLAQFLPAGCTYLGVGKPHHTKVAPVVDADWLGKGEFPKPADVVVCFDAGRFPIATLLQRVKQAKKPKGLAVLTGPQWVAGEARKVFTVVKNLDDMLGAWVCSG